MRTFTQVLIRSSLTHHAPRGLAFGTATDRGPAQDPATPPGFKRPAWFDASAACLNSPPALSSGSLPTSRTQEARISGAVKPSRSTNQNGAIPAAKRPGSTSAAPPLFRRLRTLVASGNASIIAPGNRNSPRPDCSPWPWLKRPGPQPTSDPRKQPVIWPSVRHADGTFAAHPIHPPVSRSILSLVRRRDVLESAGFSWKKRSRPVIFQLS